MDPFPLLRRVPFPFISIISPLPMAWYAQAIGSIRPGPKIALVIKCYKTCPQLALFARNWMELGKASHAPYPSCSFPCLSWAALPTFLGTSWTRAPINTWWNAIHSERQWIANKPGSDSEVSKKKKSNQVNWFLHSWKSHFLSQNNIPNSPTVLCPCLFLCPCPCPGASKWKNQRFSALNGFKPSLGRFPVGLRFVGLSLSLGLLG